MAEDVLVLTPEHVPIRLVPAGLGSRFIALTIDLFFIAALCLVLGKAVQLFLPAGLSAIVFLTGMFLITWGYHIFFEVRHQGRSPGKRFTGLRVVDHRGLPLTLPQSFVRNIVRALDVAPLFYGVGALACLCDPHNRRLGDIAASTLVIRENRPLEYAGQLASVRKFNSLRQPQVLRLIRHRVSLEEREFLLSLCLRAEALDNKARYDLMEEVGAYYREKLLIDDPHLTGENLVLDLTALLYEKRVAEVPDKPRTEAAVEA